MSELEERAQLTRAWQIRSLYLGALIGVVPVLTLAAVAPKRLTTTPPWIETDQLGWVTAAVVYLLALDRVILALIGTASDDLDQRHAPAAARLLHLFLSRTLLNVGLFAAATVAIFVATKDSDLTPWLTVVPALLAPLPLAAIVLTILTRRLRPPPTDDAVPPSSASGRLRSRSALRR